MEFRKYNGISVTNLRINWLDSKSVLGYLALVRLCIDSYVIQSYPLNVKDTR